MGCGASTAGGAPLVAVNVNVPQETPEQKRQREANEAQRREQAKHKVQDAVAHVKDAAEHVKDDLAAKKAEHDARQAEEDKRQAEENEKTKKEIQEKVAHAQEAVEGKIHEAQTEIAARKAAHDAQQADEEKRKAEQQAQVQAKLTAIKEQAEAALKQAQAAAAQHTEGASGANPSSAFDFEFSELKRQDDATSSKVISLLRSDARFHHLTKTEGAALLQRDAEDGAKLQKGIDIALAKGVLVPLPAAPTAINVDVLGKSAQAVAEGIVASIRQRQAEAGASADAAVAVVLTGLSGTGKGTTTAKLQALLPRAITWSNGNVFRALTYLINQDLEKAQGPNAELTPAFITAEAVAAAVKRLSFKPFGDAYDVVIDGVTRVADIANTELKAPKVAQRVPTVAEYTQGEVVNFAAAAVKTLQEAGHNVILEGREQTLNYIPTPYRYTLVVSDVEVLGARRAAQRVMADAQKRLEEGQAKAKALQQQQQPSVTVEVTVPSKAEVIHALFVATYSLDQ